MTDLIKLLEDCIHPIKLIDEGNHCEKHLLERIDVAINELKQVKNLAIHDVRKSFPLIEGKTKSNVKKYNGVGRQAPPPPARTIKGNVS